MKTVGEFKKAGLVFVGDDKLRSETNNRDSDEIYMSRCWLGHGSYSGFLEVSDCYFANKGWAVSSFAWRENTGVKPEFQGLVDVLVGDDKSSEQFDRINASVIVWDAHPLSRVKKWRPSLNQPHKRPDNASKKAEVIVNNNTHFSIELAEKGGFSYELKAKQSDKPIFTQAMACAGEFPLIGAKCVYVFMENGSEYTGSIAAIDGNVIWFKLDGGGYKTCFGVHKFKAVDNRTDREKAIDEMLELDLWATDREFLEAIYDAGYRKC